MAKPEQKDIDAVANLLAGAQGASAPLAALLVRLDEMTGRDFAAVSVLIDLLAKHPDVARNASLLGAVDAIQTVFTRLWDDVEAISESM